jgi:hypothetical protein
MVSLILVFCGLEAAGEYTIVAGQVPLPAIIMFVVITEEVPLPVECCL